MTTPSDPVPPPATPVTTPVRYWQAPREERAGPAPGVKFASHVPRIAAYLIDGLIIGVIYAIVLTIGAVILFNSVAPGDFRNGGSGRLWGGFLLLIGVMFLVGSALNLVYYPYFWARSGQTPGMRPFGLYVVRDVDGGRISTGQAILRLIGTWVAAIPLFLGYIWIFFDARRRGWHDLIAGTVVVERTRQD